MPADILQGITSSSKKPAPGTRRQFEFQRGPIFAHIVLADGSTALRQDPVSAARNDAGTDGDGGQDHLSAAVSLLRSGDAEPAGNGRHLPAAGSPAGSLFLQAQVEFPVAAGAAHDPGSHDQRAAGARPKVIGGDELLALRALVRQVPVARSVRDFAVRVLRDPSRSRNDPDERQAEAKPGRGERDPVRRYVRYGASPRGAQAPAPGRQSDRAPRWSLRRFLRRRAARRPSRPAPSPDPQLRGQAEGVDPDDIIGAILERTPENAPDLPAASPTRPPARPKSTAR